MGNVTKTSRNLTSHTKIVVDIVSNLIRTKTDLEKRFGVVHASKPAAHEGVGGKC
jgi:hypothetical protein